MRKTFNEVLTSKLFIFTFVVSLFTLVALNIKYQNNACKNERSYNIVEEYDKNLYDEEILKLNEMLEALNEKDEDYNENKKYLTDCIKIYEKLYQNNINYKDVYDFGYGSQNDSTTYLIKSQTAFFLIVIINFIVILYLIFTREFDKNIYLLIYENKRYNIIIKKIATSLVLYISLFLIYFLLLGIFSSFFADNYKYVLIVDRENIHFVKKSLYIFNDIFMYLLYISLFFIALLWVSSLFIKKSISVIIALGIIALVLFVGGFLKLNIVIYLGLAIDYSIINYNMLYLTRIFIIIPIGLLIYSIYHFEKCDL